MKQEHIEWVVQARSGNVASFSALYSLYCNKVYALVCSMVDGEKDVEDVVQETFIRAWKYIGALGNPSSFDVWIHRIAHNRCNTYQQKRYKKNLSEVPLEAEDTQGLLTELEAEEESIPSIYVERGDLKQQLNEIIMKLNDSQRETFTLYYMNHMSAEEIARVMDCSENTVWSRLRLARKAIRNAIEQWEKETGEGFYYGAGVPLIPFGEAMSRGIQPRVMDQAVSQSILNLVLSGISTMPAAPMAGAYKGRYAADKAKQAAAFARKGLSPVMKGVIGGTAVVVVGVGLYAGAMLGKPDQGEPVAALAPEVTQLIPAEEAAPAWETPWVTPSSETTPAAAETPAEAPAVTAALEPQESPQPALLPSGDYITWSDPAFEAAVRASMGIPQGPIAVSTAQEEKWLQLTLPRSVRLDDLQYFPNLENLELNGLGTLDLSPLSGLSELQELHIIGVRASDWKQLSGLASLKWLSLTNTDISNPTWLSKLTGLELLHFSGVNLFDLTLLCGLPALESLQITDCALKDITPLSAMRTLTWLSVKNTEVSDLSPLSGLTGLKWLDVSGTKVENLSPVTSWQSPPHVVADGL